MVKFINTREEHNQVLFDLGLLDDDDDWPLYCKLQEKLEDDIDIKTYWKYVIKPKIVER